MLGDRQKKQVERLAGFEFDDAGFIAAYRESHSDSPRAMSARRLRALGDFVRSRASQLV